MTTETEFNKQVLEALDKGTQFTGRLRGKDVHICDKYEDGERLFAAWWGDHPNQTSFGPSPAIALFDLPSYETAGITLL